MSALPKLMRGECLALMATLPDKSVDLIACDLPYGTTACAWDTVIPFDALWAQYRRIAKDSAAIVLTASQPFTSALIMSNIKDYRHRWVWDKVKPASGLNAKKSPLRSVEDIVVFSKNSPTYIPQMEPKKHRAERKFDSNGEAFGGARVERHHDNGGLGYPKEILTISNANQTNRFHPTQKPVALMDYLIRTYTNEGDTVLDNCMGSGTTGEAAVRAGRNFIGMEMNAEYFTYAQMRVVKSWMEANGHGGLIAPPANKTYTRTL